MITDEKARRLRIYISSTDKYKHTPLYEVIVYSAVEIIDEPHKIDSFFESIKPLFDKIGKGHLITVDETAVLVHRTGVKK